MAGGADQNLNIVVKLKDEASAQFSNLQKKMEGVQKSIAPAADVSKKFALALAGAGTAAVGFGVVAVKAAMEAQADMAKFEATMKTVKGATEESRKALLDRAQAVTKMGFDDEEAANNMAKLYQRTGDVNKAMELNNLAMDLARDKNISLTEAGNLVGMVMSGNGRALKQYGIEISDTMTPMEGLGVLQEKVAGQSAAFSSTLKGQSEALSVSWGNFLEMVGEKLIPIMQKLLEKYLIPFVNETLPKWIENMQNINKWLSEHQTVLLIVAGAIAGLLVPAVISFGIAAATAFATAAVAAAPWLIGGAIIGALIAGVVWLVKNWETVKAKLSEIWAAITGQFKGMINSLISMGEGWVNGFIDGINGIIKGLNKIKIDMPDWAGGKSFGVNIPSVSRVSIPRMEHGGIIQAPRGTAVPIIAHGGEQVIPAGSAGGGSASIMVNIYNPVVTSRNEAHVLQEQINNALRDVMRNHKLQAI